MQKKSVTAAQVVAYALSIAEDKRDTGGEIILTWIDEDCIDHFDLTDEEYEDHDFSFQIFKAMQKKGLVE